MSSESNEATKIKGCLWNSGGSISLQKLPVFFRRAIMPAGANAKREREYKKLVGEFKKEHRYPGREEEVAARIVNKQRAEHGETKEEKDK
jgi:hypothetical protein